VQLEHTMTQHLLTTPPHLSDKETIEPKVARDLIIQAYGELVLHLRQAAAERGECPPSEAHMLAEHAMRSLLGPAFDAPTKADLLVAKKRLDSKVGFSQASPAVREQLDESCLYVAARTR
jgi:hypothetical protein